MRSLLYFLQVKGIGWAGIHFKICKIRKICKIEEQKTFFNLNYKAMKKTFLLAVIMLMAAGVFGQSIDTSYKYNPSQYAAHQLVTMLSNNHPVTLNGETANAEKLAMQMVYVMNPGMVWGDTLWIVDTTGMLKRIDSLKRRCDMLDSAVIDASDFPEGSYIRKVGGVWTAVNLDSIVNARDAVKMAKSDSSRFANKYKDVDSITIAAGDSVTLTAEQHTILINSGEGSIIKLDSSLQNGKEYELIFLSNPAGTKIKVNDGYSLLLMPLDRTLVSIYTLGDALTIYFIIRNGIWYIK
jgi:hypothetical protein